MSDSSDIFSFLNNVWDLLPEQDKLNFGETWRAYEQTYGDVYTKLFERDFGVSIQHLPLYNNQRWLKHEFDSSTQVNRAATYRTNQDVSKGLNLSVRNLIRFSVDGGPQIEVNLQGASPTATTNFEIVAKINQAAGFSFAQLVVENALINLTSSTTGPTSKITFYPASSAAADASAVILGLDPADLPISFPKFPYEFQLGDRFLVHIPALRDKVHEELATTVLREGTDYEIEFGTGIISFAAVPPVFLWAKDNLVNLETPYNNFGYLLDIYDTNTASYLKAVKGLWFAFWTGPRPENIKRSLYLLFGLPTASKVGTVFSVTPTQITLQYQDNSQETFDIPSGLLPAVAAGNPVSQFEPLVTGISVLDKINSPGFLAREVGRTGVQPFLTESATRGVSPKTDESKAIKTIEQNSYLPQIDVDAFISPDIKLSNVRTFLKNIQPKSRTYLFQVLVGTFRDELDVLEHIGLDISFDVTPNLDYHPNLEVSQADLDDAETNPNSGLIMDSEGIAVTDRAEVDVFHSGTLVDSFTIQG